MIPASPALVAILAFDASNQLAVRKLGSKAGLPFTGTDLAMATVRLESAFLAHTVPAEYFSADAGGRSYRVFFAQVSDTPVDREIDFESLDDLAAKPTSLAPSLAVLLSQLTPHLVEIP